MVQKIALIDGYSLLYRAFFALPLMDNGAGRYTNAVYGFMNMLLKVLDTEKPDALAVAFDVDKHTFRHERFAEYKAGRAPTPDEMKSQIDTVKELLTLMGVPILIKPGYEADDILGTVSRICEEKGIQAVIVTGDRDAYQLAGEYTAILLTRKGITETQRVTPSWIRDNFGLEPAQMIDVKSLMGDASDNIPGVPGIGEKTALKLMAQYGSLDALYDRAEAELKGAVREKILRGKESAYMSRFLAEINRHVPMEVDPDACAIGDFSAALPLLKELRLRTILEKMDLKPAAGANRAGKAAYEIRDLMRPEPRELNEKLCELAAGAGQIAFDISGVISASADTGVCLVCERGGDLLSPGLSDEEAAAALQKAAAVSEAKWIFFNGKDIPGSNAAFEGRCEDLMLAGYVINPQAELRSPRDVGELVGAGEYADCPAAGILDAWRKAESRMEADGLTRLYREIELPLSFVLGRMEKQGFRVDADYLKQLGDIYTGRISELTERIYALAGHSLNLNSPKQLKQLLFEEMKLPVPGGKKTAPGTSAEILEALAEDYPICGLILEYRKYQKLDSTYVHGLTAQIGADGRVHTRFEQAVTGTGRISSREPNLQNIPVRTAQGREIRRAFIPREGCVLVDADYSQIELRVLAGMSGDDNMRDAFLKQQDIHARTASEVFGVPLDEVTGELRSRAKAVNFGIVYGISEYGLAKNTGCGVKEAAGFIKAYFARYPGIRRYMDEQVRLGKANGCVTTLFGRRRYLPELNSTAYQMRSFGERAAMNSPIQGTAADIIKLAMVRIDRELNERGMRTRLILQVHDELILESPAEEVPRACALLKDCMENAAEVGVPLVCETRTGGNWNECKP